MADWLMWFTQMQNSKVFALLLFFITFCLIVLYVYGGRQRGARLEAYRYIPLDDDDMPKRGAGDE